MKTNRKCWMQVPKITQRSKHVCYSSDIYSDILTSHWPIYSIYYRIIYLYIIVNTHSIFAAIKLYKSNFDVYKTIEYLL